jgi:hypothetical protein
VSAAATYTLKHAVTRTLKGADEAEREETLLEVGAEIQLRRIKGKDLRAMDDHAGEMGKAFAIMAKVTNQQVSVIDAMDAEDIAGLQEQLDGFLPASLRTGPTSSGT